MRKTKRIGRLMVLGAAGALALAGCTKDTTSTGNPGAGSGHVAQGTGQEQRGGTMLRAGEAPLDYLVVADGHVTIVDVTLGQPVVSHLPIRPQTLIAIDQITGINVGAEKVLGGPLPLHHRFEIWWDK